MARRLALALLCLLALAAALALGTMAGLWLGSVTA